MKNKKIIIIILVALFSIFLVTYKIDDSRFYSNRRKSSDKYNFKILYLLVDEEKVTKNDSIYEITHNKLDSILYQVNQSFSLKEDGKYLVADLKEFDNEIVYNNVLNYVFTLNDLGGNVINDCVFDEKNFIIKIPKEYYKSIKNDSIPVQMEIINGIKDKNIKNVPIDLKVKNIYTKKSKVYAYGRNLDTYIQLTKYKKSKLKKSDLSIYINNSEKKLSKKSYDYDAKTGTLKIDYPAVLIKNIDVNVGKNLFNKIANVSTVYAECTPSEDGWTCGGDRGGGNNALESAIYQDTAKVITLTKAPKKIPTPVTDFGYTLNLMNAVETTIKSNGYVDTYLYNDNGVKKDYSSYNLTFGLNLGDLNNDKYELYSEYGFVFPNIKIALYCNDHSEQGSSTANDLPVTLRIDDYNASKRYLIVTIVTGPVNSQAGASIVKLTWPEPTEAKVRIEKKAYDGTTAVSRNKSGVKFGIYTDSTCKTKVSGVKDATTDSDGLATFKGLEVGTTYYVKEIDGGDNFPTTSWTLDKGCKNISITSSDKQDSSGVYYNENRLNFNNRKKRYCYKVKKVDEHNQGCEIEGVTFTNSDGTTKTTDSNGIVTFKDLPYGSYTVKETTPNDTELTLHCNTTIKKYRYWNNNSDPVAATLTEMNWNGTDYTCSANSTDNVKYNRKQYFCLKVKKVDAATGAALPGAQFTTTVGGTQVTKTTDSNGIATFMLGTNPGTYTVTETKAPAGYALPTESSKNVTATRMPSTIIPDTANDESKCNADVTNYVYSDPKILLNWYKETEKGSAASGAKFKVSKGNSYIIVSSKENQTDASNPAITKSCYKYSGTTTDKASASELVSDAAGEVCISGLLDTGTYTIEETKPAKYHTFDSKLSITASASTVFSAKTNSNKFVDYETVFEFTKKVSGSVPTDEQTKNEIKKMKFNVYNKNADGTTGSRIKFKQSGAFYEYSGNTIDGVAGTEIYDLVLNDNLKFTIKHLPIGNYVLKEVDSGKCTDGSSNCENCSGYYLPTNNDVPFTITECSSANAQACGNSKGIVTADLDNTPTEITLTKKDIFEYVGATDVVKFENAEEVKIFDSITFRLKGADGNYLQLQKVSDGVYRYTKGTGSNQTYDLHTKNGTLKVTHLCKDSTYTMEEYAIPDNNVYILPSTHPTVTYTIPNKGNATTNSNNRAEISNTPTKIEIQKKDNRTNSALKESSEKKETAKFEVYKCAYNVTKCTKSQAIGGAIKFKNLSTVGGEKVYKFMLNQTVTSGYVQTLNLEENGKIILRYLPTGYKYVVVETNAPDGYYDVTGDFAELQVEPSKTTTENKYDFINHHTKIKFTKDDIYKYYKATDQAKLNEQVKIFDSMTFRLYDENGSLVKLSKVQDGEYRFIQNDGTHSGNTITDLHTSNGNMIITHLYRKDSSYSGVYYLEEYKSDPEGNFILPNNIDNSKILETKATGLINNKHPLVKYSIPNSDSTTISNNTVPESLTELIENLPTRVRFEKRDKKTGELIKDELNPNPYTKTTFRVYQCKKNVEHCTVDNGKLIYFENRAYISGDKEDVDENGNPVLAYKYSKLNSSAGAVADLNTDHGILIIRYLPSNYKYVLYETVAPDGYYNPVKQEAQTEFIVKSESHSETLTYEPLTSKILNTPTKIIFKKEDIYNYYHEDDQSKMDSNVKIFDSMEFVLRNSKGEKLNLKCTGNLDSDGNCSTGEYRYLPVDSNNKFDKLHTKNGTFTVTHLYRNQVYYIEEVKNDPEGIFILPDYLKYEGLPFDNKGHPVVKYTLPNNKPATDESITEIIDNTPSRVRIEKRDSKYNYLIPDETTTFNVYQCEKTVDTCNPENGTLMYFTERAFIKDDNEDPGVEVYKYSKLNSKDNAVKDLHPYYGVLVLRYLPSNYKYVLVETIAPVNYLLPIDQDAYTQFEISGTKVDVEEIDVPNKPTAMIIRKYATDGGLLEGAEFKIYEGLTCDPNLIAMNQPKKLVKLKTIRDGVYEYRPVADTDTIITCTDREDEKCSDIPVNESTKLTYNKYLGTYAEFENTINSDGDNIEIKAGEALIQYLEYGHCYIIEEVKAPKGYSLPEKDSDRFTMLTIKPNEKYYVDTFKELVNKPTPFTFYKFDEYNNPLDGAEFKLQKLNDNKIYIDVPVTKMESENGLSIYKVDEESENKVITTTNGSATVYYLSAGQYRIVETKPAEGKELTKNPNIATFFVDDSGNVYGNSIIVNKAKTIKVEYKPEDSAELIINISTGQTVIKYSLIIALLVAFITGLMILKNKEELEEKKNERTRKKDRKK